MAGAPTKLPTMLVGAGCLSWVLFSGGTGGSGETSPCGAALAWGKGAMVNT